MQTMQTLREQRAAKARECRQLLDDNPDKWDGTLQSRYDALVSEITDLDGRVAREQRMLDVEAESAFPGAKLPTFGGEGAKGKDALADLRDKWFRGGDGALSAEDWQRYRNTMSTTTPAQGGYTVESQVASEVLDKLKLFGGVREAGPTILRTANGAPFSWPTSDGTAETGEILAENAAATDLDISFGTTALNTYKFSSKVVTVPIELLQDSQVDIEAFVNNRLATRLGRITNTKFTVGTGTGEPQGVVTGATAGATTAGATAITYNDILALVHSVDPAYRNSGPAGQPKFMWNDLITLYVRKLVDGQSRPLWVPSYDGGVQGAQPDRFVGYPIVTNQDMNGAVTTGLITALFGNFSYYTIREVMAITYYRFTDSAYAKKGQVGFLAMMRAGGAATDVGGAIRKLTQA